MRPTLFVPIVIVVLVCTVPLVLGVKLLMSPRHTGNDLHDAFIVFPAVESFELGKARCYRALGAILIAVSAGAIYSAYMRVMAIIQGR